MKKRPQTINVIDVWLRLVAYHFAKKDKVTVAAGHGTSAVFELHEIAIIDANDRMSPFSPMDPVGELYRCRLSWDLFSERGLALTQFPPLGAAVDPEEDLDAWRGYDGA